MVTLMTNFFTRKSSSLKKETVFENSKKDFGWRNPYAEIYKNNKKIIKDPDLIFPGQVFNIPNLKHSSLNE